MANNEDELKVLRAATIWQKTVQAGNSFMVFRDDEKGLDSHCSSHFLQFSMVPMYF